MKVRRLYVKIWLVLYCTCRPSLWPSLLSSLFSALERLLKSPNSFFLVSLMVTDVDRHLRAAGVVVDF